VLKFHHLHNKVHNIKVVCFFTFSIPCITIQSL